MEPKKRIAIVCRVEPYFRCIVNAARHETAAKNALHSAEKHMLWTNVCAGVLIETPVCEEEGLPTGQ
jgi:hypothetical protein